MPVNRRSILSATAALSALAVPAVASPESPDADVFAAAQAVEKAWGALERSTGLMSLFAVERKLAETRATTMDGLRCKARISDLLREENHPVQPIASSLVKELLALW
jgi:hypothetical protein